MVERVGSLPTSPTIAIVVKLDKDTLALGASGLNSMTVRVRPVALFKWRGLLEKDQISYVRLKRFDSVTRY